MMLEVRNAVALRLLPVNPLGMQTSKRYPAANGTEKPNPLVTGEMGSV